LLKVPGWTIPAAAKVWRLAYQEIPTASSALLSSALLTHGSWQPLSERVRVDMVGYFYIHLRPELTQAIICPITTNILCLPFYSLLVAKSSSGRVNSACLPWYSKKPREGFLPSRAMTTRGSCVCHTLPKSFADEGKKTPRGCWSGRFDGVLMART
jgi:hypothetical protein